MVGEGVTLPLLECDFMLWPMVKIFGFILGGKTTEATAAGPTVSPAGSILPPPLFLPQVVTQSCHAGISGDKPPPVPAPPLVPTTLARWWPESTGPKSERVGLTEKRRCQENCSSVGHWQRHTELDADVYVAGRPETAIRTW